MITGWEKTESCWMNIGSPDYVQWQRLKGYLEIQKQESSHYGELKKNDMRLLRNDTSKLLRQEDETYTRSVLRGCQNISGSGNATRQMQEVRESETGGVDVDSEQSLLHEAIWNLCRQEVPCDDNQGCGKGIETGLAHRKDIGEGIYAGTASP